MKKASAARNQPAAPAAKPDRETSRKKQIALGGKRAEPKGEISGCGRSKP
jgi:hypothetical protein